MAQPDGTDDKNHNPNDEDNSVKLITLELAEESEAVAFEDGRADHRGENVIGKSHLAHRCEPLRYPTQGNGLDDQQNHRYVTESRDAPNFIGDPVTFTESTLKYCLAHHQAVQM
jgi:hypothetical protein